MTPVDVISLINAVGGLAVIFFVLFPGFKIIDSAVNSQSTLNLSSYYCLTEFLFTTVTTQL
jgi:hypothetical protein